MEDDFGEEVEKREEGEDSPVDQPLSVVVFALRADRLKTRGTVG